MGNDKLQNNLGIAIRISWSNSLKVVGIKISNHSMPSSIKITVFTISNAKGDAII